ncbi:MAG TPA: hypothetical protein DDZ51_22770 [Planctomycetaceae bacterium]|nr:hypothetical protein [Planctomycetaceae bacterium]
MCLVFLLYASTTAVYVPAAWQRLPVQPFFLQLTLPESCKPGPDALQVALKGSGAIPDGGADIKIRIEDGLGGLVHEKSLNVSELALAQVLRFDVPEKTSDQFRDDRKLVVTFKSDNEGTEFCDKEVWQIAVLPPPATKPGPDPPPPVRTDVLTLGTPIVRWNEVQIPVIDHPSDRGVELTLSAEKGASRLAARSISQSIAATSQRQSLHLQLAGGDHPEATEVALRISTSAPNVKIVPNLMQLQIPSTLEKLLVLYIDVNARHLADQRDFADRMAAFSVQNADRLARGGVVAIRPGAETVIASGALFGEVGFPDGQFSPIANRIAETLSFHRPSTPVMIIWPAIIGPEEAQGAYGAIRRLSDEYQVDVIIWWGGDAKSTSPPLLKSWLPDKSKIQPVYVSNLIFQLLEERMAILRTEAP